ncbi:MAG TPA: hypothetical protein VK196_11970 [Magnetospirillum sp.]|nr:hypothetical protein [Magnetospirillum sp.]
MMSTVAAPVVNPIWAGPCLLVPLVPEALLVGQPNQTEATWAQTAFDYSALPYASPQPVPFSTDGGVPELGLHLTWTLPSSLRSGAQQADASAVTFRSVPNRWLVTRSFVPDDGEPPVLTAWVLQSDYTGDDGLSSWPDPDGGSGYTGIGKVVPLASWTATPGPNPPFLQAVAPANVAFAAIYQASRGVFSFYDPLGDDDLGSYAYSILGWYADPAADPLYGPAGGFTDQAQWQSLMGGLDWRTATALSTAQAAWQAWLTANPVTGGPPATPAQLHLASQTLCHGLLHSIPWQGTQHRYELYTVDIQPDPPAVAVGATAAEALAAWIASQSPATVRQEVETMMLAFQNGLVFEYATDTAKFEMVTQAARFASTRSGDVWVVTRPTDANTSPDAQGGNSTVPLNPEQTDLLIALNAAQMAQDYAQAALASLREALFGALWKQINWTRASHIDKQQVLAYVNRLVGELIPAAEDAVQAQAAAVADAADRLRPLLAPEFELSTISAPTNQGPMDPVVLVAGAGLDTKLARPEAFGGDPMDGRFTGQTITALTVQVQGTPVTLTADDVAAAGLPTGVGIPKEFADLVVECVLLDPANARWMARLCYGRLGIPHPTDAQLDTVAAAIRAIQAAPFSDEALALAPGLVIADAVGLTGVPPARLSVEPWVTPWTPVYMDWQVAWMPTAAAPQDMLADWELADVDYVWNGSSLSAPAQTYSGRTTLTPNQALQLNESIDQFLAVAANRKKLPDFDLHYLQLAAQELTDLDVLAQAMGGLSDQMAMRLQQPTSIADAPQAQMAAGAQGYIPMATAQAFYPVRSGHMAIRKLWIVDAYGQVLKAVDVNRNPQPVVSASLATPGFPGVLQTVPRAAQPARLDARLVSAVDDSVRSNSSDATSPIAGWLVPNHLDDSLTVYDAAGNNLGALITVINDQGRAIRWDPVPGAAAPLGTPPQIANPHLAGLVHGLLDLPTGGAQADALAALLDAIDVTTWKTDPLGQPTDGNLSVLQGRPMAVVRMAASLRTGGLPWVDQSWAATGKDVTGGFTDTVFPVRVGDHGLDDNGTAGYYLGDDYGTFYAARGFHPGLGRIRRAIAGRPAAAAYGRRLPDRLLASLPGWLAGPSSDGGYVVTDATLALPLNDTPQYLTAIVDPRGGIPCVSGIQPVDTLALPPGPVAAALQTMFITFRMGPLMTDPAQLTMPLPGAVGGTWSWIERSGVSVWREDGNIVPPAGEAALASTPPTLREGWLKLTGAMGSDKKTRTVKK